jgi:hypothetical protein
MVAPFQRFAKVHAYIIARGDFKAAALVSKYQMTPLKDWAKSSSSELRGLHSRATTPYMAAHAGLGVDAAFTTLAEQLDGLFRSELPRGEAAQVFAKATDGLTQQPFAPDIVQAYKCLLEVQKPDELNKVAWFVAALAQVHIMRTASSGLKGLLLGDMGLEEEFLR